MIVRGSTPEVLLTVKVKATGPPGSGSTVGAGVLVTDTEGGTSVSRTVAWASAVVSFPSLSVAVAVTVSVWAPKALPVYRPVNEHA